MTLSIRTRSLLAGLAFLAGMTAPLTPPARAEGLQRFTGYANPGTPDDITRPNGEIVSAADEPGAFGGSVYFMVLDRGEGRGNDTWGSGIKDFDNLFQAGVDDAVKPSPGLDKKARYLYLYQVVNDRGSKSPVHEVTIRLVIEPSLITSWGFFGAADNEKHAAATGVGFAQDVGAKNAVVAVSTQNPVGPTKRPFVKDAPRHTVPKAYEMAQIGVNNPTKAVADDPTAENTGRSPVAVVLLKNADFRNAPPIHTEGRLMTYDPSQVRDAAEVRPAAPLAPVEPAAPVMPIGFNGLEQGLGLSPFAPAFGVTGAENFLDAAVSSLRPVIFAGADADGRPDSSRSPAIRALFYDKPNGIPVRQGERSVLFGFTSNFPPMFEAARLRGSEFVAAAAIDTAGAVGAANLRVDADEVPTPVAFEQTSAPVTGIGSAVGSLGGGETVGAGSPGGFSGGVPGGLGGGLGGGTGGGTSGGSNGQGQGQAQAQQQQQPTPTPTPSPNTNTTIVTVAQQQGQQQQQQQKQKQQQQQQQQQCNCNMPGNVVPEPASLASALLGVPFLFLFLRRRKPAVV